MRSDLARRAVYANAVFSACAGLALVSAPRQTSSLLGVDQDVLLRVVGVGLIGFALLALATQRLGRAARSLGVVAVCLADGLWVIGSIALLLIAGSSFSTAGVVTVAAVAVIVASFAIAQLVGVDRVYRSPGHVATHRVCLDCATGGHPDELWRTVRDLGAIAQYAPGLATSSLRGDETVARVGSVRLCTARNGDRWSERCTALDDADRCVELTFLTSQAGFPFPFRTMTGGWAVREASVGCVVRVWWDATPTRRWLAPLIFPVMELQATRTLTRTLDAMIGSMSVASTVEHRARRLVASAC